MPAPRYKNSSSIRKLGRAGISAANSTLNVADKAAAGLFRHLTDDPTGMRDAFSNIPKMGFVDTVKHILMLFMVGVASAIISGIITFIFIAYGIPYLFEHMIEFMANM